MADQTDLVASNSAGESVVQGTLSLDPMPTLTNLPSQYNALDITAAFGEDFVNTSFAEEAANAAQSFVEQLQAIAAQVIPPVINPDFPVITSPPTIVVPQPPTTQPIVYIPPPVPAPFTGTLTLEETFPNFTAAPPNLIFPNVPAQPQLTIPQAATVDLNFTYPTVQVDLPAAPDLLQINVIPFSGVTMPTFSATAPVLNLVEPQIIDYIANAPYTDALLQLLQSTLQDRIANGTNTGLPPAIEQNLWNRAREREYLQAADALSELDRMESMGYSLPSGAWLNARIKIENELGEKIAGLSRDIAIQQAQLIHDDIIKSLDISVTLESKLIDYANSTEQRRFEAAKYVTEAGVSIYNSQVQAFGEIVNVYRAAIDVYNAQIQAQMTLVQIYKAEIEAETLKVQANDALVQQYKVMVDAALASIQVFQGEVEIIKTQAEVEQIKVSIFGEEVRAYAAQVNAFTAEVEAYKAQIESQTALEQVYEVQANVFKTQVDATVAEINAQVEVFKAQLAEKEQEYDAYKAQVESEAEAVRAIAAANTSIAQIYSAEVQGQSSYNEALIKEWDAALQIAVQETQIGVSAAQANIQGYLTAKQILTDAAKVGGTVEAQIASSALGSVTYATHRSRQDSVNISQSQNQNMALSKSVSAQASAVAEAIHTTQSVE